MNIKPANLFIITLLVAVIAIVVPILYAKGAATIVYLSVTRVEPFSGDYRVDPSSGEYVALSRGDYVALSHEMIMKHPAILSAMNEADKRLDAFLSWCDSKLPANCMDFSEAKVHVIGYTTEISETEAKAALVDLSFQDIHVPDEIATLHHGTHVEYNGKNYAIAIAGL